MAKPRFLSVALIAAAMLATPAMARESNVTSRHLAEDANASTTPVARHIGGGDCFCGNHFGGGFGVIPGEDYGGYGEPRQRFAWRIPRIRGSRCVGPLGHLLWAHGSDDLDRNGTTIAYRGG